MTAPTDNPAIASKEDEETDWWHGPRLRSAGPSLAWSEPIPKSKNRPG